MAISNARPTGFKERHSYRLYSTIGAPRISLVPFQRLFLSHFYSDLWVMILKKLPGYSNHHEYLRDTLGSKNIECFSCKKNNLFACIRCTIVGPALEERKRRVGEESTYHVNSYLMCKIKKTILVYIESLHLLCYF